MVKLRGWKGRVVPVVRGIPTLMLFKNGSVEATKVGALSKSQLIAFIDSHI